MYKQFYITRGAAMVQVRNKEKLWCGLLLWSAALAGPVPNALAADPDIEARFREGMEALEDEKLKSAASAFQNILNQDPSLNRAKLELALAYYRSLRYEDAEQLAQEVLDDPLTPAEVRVTVLAFLAQVRHDSEQYGQKHNFSPFVSGGVMHDSNINVGPTNADIRIGDTPATLTESSLKQSGNAGIVDLGFNHLYQSDKRVELGERTGMLVWQSGADVYWRKYHDYGDYDIAVASFNTGPAVLLLRHWRAGVQLRSNYLNLGGHSLGWFNSVNPTVTWQLNNAELSWDTIYTRRFYHKDADSGREGDYVATGLDYGRYFNNRRVAATGGLRLIKFFADDDQYGYTGFQVSAGLSTETYPDATAYLRGRYGYYDYDGQDEQFGKTREENEYVVTAGLTHSFVEPEDLFKGWVANLFWERTENDSNIGDVYSYKRYQTMLSLTRTF
jgi:tetratricopeptide (TPR) repeat protein